MNRARAHSLLSVRGAPGGTPGRRGARASRRGSMMLGMIPMIALLAALAWSLHSAALEQYRTTGQAHWRRSARQFALGGIATARARLAANPQWTGEDWEAAPSGRCEVRALETRPDGSWLVEAVAMTPGSGARPQITLGLRAVLTPSPQGGLPEVRLLGWSNTAGNWAGRGESEAAP